MTQAGEGKHEQTDMNPKYVLYFGLALVLLGVVIFAGVWWMFQQLDPGGPRVVEAPKDMPEPRLQINPEGDLEELRRQEAEILSTYRWVDREKGTVRIPIDRAMQLFIERQQK